MPLKEEELEIPLPLVEKSVGFSLDIGASTGKLVYRSKKEFKGGKSIHETSADKGIVHLAKFAHNELDAALDVINERADVTWKDGDAPVKVTGVGCNLFKDRIEQKLQVKIDNQDEFASIVKALMSLRNAEDIFTPLPQKALQDGKAVIGVYKGMREAMGARMKPMGFRDDIIMQTAREIRLSCLVAVCGSVCAMIKIEEDGSYEFLEGQLLAGKFFLGFSTVLLGKKPFEELMEEVLAADGSTCDYMMSEIITKDLKQQQLQEQRLKQQQQEQQKQQKQQQQQASDSKEAQEKPVPQRKDSETNVYNSWDRSGGDDGGGDKMRLFPMSKVLDIPRDQVKNADAANSMLHTVCEILSFSVCTVAAVHGLDQVYFVGNFANIPRVRHWLTKYMSIRQSIGYTPEPIDFQFPKLGGHLGSVGAFIM